MCKAKKKFDEIKNIAGQFPTYNSMNFNGLWMNWEKCDPKKIEKTVKNQSEIAACEQKNH